MANWFDIVSFLAVGVLNVGGSSDLTLGWLEQTAVFFGAVIYGIVFVIRSVTESLESTKEKLKEKGYDISSGGVKVKTQKRFNREDYVDATQRQFVKAMEASSFRKGGAQDGSPGSSPKLEPPALLSRSSSSNSTSSDKKNFFSRKKKE
ncbi:hypothetical protein WG66_016876 [Moniliophthora roreri]|uniref:Uncharacterized protein n=1 Tax=Moniliophthora roreri TaxID=221103 RepID=A0A0W0F5X1_MONRR|nr:hypothetical protein WG66_016876 [Moniliophthora roreri]